MMPRTNSQFVAASLTEFLSVWSMGGEANLNLATKGGNLNIQFCLSLGTPGAPFSPSPPVPPPAPPPYKARHRGPAQKERNRQRATRHQAAKTTSSAESVVPSIDPMGGSAISAEVIPVTASVTAPETANTSSVTASQTIVAASVTAASTTSTVSVALLEHSTNCELCDFHGVSTVGFKIHKSRKHEDIPQIYGATF